MAGGNNGAISTIPDDGNLGVGQLDDLGQVVFPAINNAGDDHSPDQDIDLQVTVGMETGIAGKVMVAFENSREPESETTITVGWHRIGLLDGGPIPVVGVSPG